MRPSRSPSTLVGVVLPALTMLSGMQALRALMGLQVYVLRDRLGWSAVQIGVLAFALFACGFLAAPLWRLLGVRRMVLVTAAGLALLRLGMQLANGEPLAVLVLAGAAVVLFVLFLPSFLLAARPEGPTSTGRYGLALLLGIALDTALHGLLLTWDLVWRLDLWAVLATAGIALLQILLVLLWTREEAATSTASGGPSLPWLAVGPALALTLIMFQNIAQLGALTGWPMGPTFAWIMLGQALGLAGAVALPRQGFSSGWPSVAGAGAVLIVATALPSGRPVLAAAWILVGQVALAFLVVTTLRGLGRMSGRAHPGRLGAANGGGMVLFVLVLFLVYARYDLALPLPASVLPPVAAGLIALCAVLTVRGPRAAAAPAERGHADAGRQGRAGLPWKPAAASLVFLLIPAAVWLLTPAPRPAQPTGGPVRVMTYNLHNGFDTRGRLGLEALARTIEEQKADVVALQEVVRGWVVDGSADMLGWLSLRLGMPYVSGPTAGPFWGNAVLSRYPILAAEAHPLPTQDLLLRRGYLQIRIDVGAGKTLTVLATHYHHPDDGGPVRVLESRAILDAWSGDHSTVFMGDLNAEPGAQEMQMLRDAGLVDVVALAGPIPGYTYSSEEPGKRIDYLWVSPDLAGTAASPGLRDVVITSGNASDHLGVAATITP